MAPLANAARGPVPSTESMHRRVARSLRGARSSWLVVAAPLVMAMAGGRTVGALPKEPGPRGEQTPEQAMVEEQPVCIGSSVSSAGRLSDVLYYRAVATGDGHIAVGYFAFYSEERPWGNNWLTWSVVPALAVDMVYSRALWVAPGLQRALYGAGDVEGVAVVYAVGRDGSLSVDHAIVDDRDERPVAISRAQVLALDAARPTFYSDVWSHQLGGRDARSRRDLVEERCYEGDSIRPLPDAVARAFRIDDDRAPPAHVERMDGRRIDAAPADAVLARAVN
jgi:hypothetical protein